jgi:hypothetical protein
MAARPHELGRVSESSGLRVIKMAALIDPSVVLFARLSAGLTIAVGVVCPMHASVLESSGVPAVLALLARPAAGFAFALPRLRVQAFGSRWRVPAQACLLPRWLIRLLLGSMMMAATSLALVAGARKRFRTHPRTEFVMPCGYIPCR